MGRPISTTRSSHKFNSRTLCRECERALDSITGAGCKRSAERETERANKSEMSHRCKIVILWLLNILHGIFRATFSTFESHRFRKMNQTNGKYVIFRMTLSNCLFFPIIILFLVKCIDFHIPQNFIHLHNSLPIDVHRLFRRIVSPKNRWLVNSNPRI